MHNNAAPQPSKNRVIKRCVIIAVIFLCIMAFYFASIHVPFLANTRQALQAALPRAVPNAAAPQIAPNNTVSTFSRQSRQGASSNRFSKFTADTKAESTQAEPNSDQSEPVCGMTAEESTAFHTVKKDHMGIASSAALKIEIAKFISSASPEEQLAGLFMQVENNWKIALLAEWESDPSCNPWNEQQNHLRCSEKTVKITEANRNVALNELITYALSVKSPDAYAAAWYACAGRTTDACKKISARTWALADADNLSAWLAAATEARANEDAAGLEYAIRAALAAKSDDKRFPNIAILLDTDSMRQQSPLAQFGAAVDVSLGPVLSGRLAGGIVNYCGLSNAVPQSRQADCAAITTKYLDAALSYYGMSNALALADRWGQNAEKVQAIREERDAYQRIQFADREDPNSQTSAFAFSCKRMGEQIETIISELKIGQRAVAKTQFARWQKTPAQILGGARRIEDAGKPNGK